MNYYRTGLQAASTKQVVGVTNTPDVATKKAGDSPLVVVGILAGLLGLTYGVVPLIHKGRARKVVHTTYRHPGGYKAKGKVIDV